MGESFLPPPLCGLAPEVKPISQFLLFRFLMGLRREENQRPRTFSTFRLASPSAPGVGMSRAVDAVGSDGTHRWKRGGNEVLNPLVSSEGQCSDAAAFCSWPCCSDPSIKPVGYFKKCDTLQCLKCKWGVRLCGITVTSVFVR